MEKSLIAPPEASVDQSSGNIAMNQMAQMNNPSTQMAPSM